MVSLMEKSARSGVGAEQDHTDRHDGGSLIEAGGMPSPNAQEHETMYGNKERTIWAF